MSELVLALLLVGIAVPHRLSLAGARPATAALLWSANLALRAIAGVLVAVYLILYLPSTQLFEALTHWCWHWVLPLLATHLGLNGHSIGDLAAVLPTVIISLAVFWGATGMIRVARSVQRLLKRSSLGAGPDDSVILGGSEVIVAAAGLTRPRVVVSAGALTQLDDAELAAGLDHERGHIARRHRWIMVYAEACRALAVFIPGTRTAVRELHLQLERDADEWALLRRHDRLALASAIIKAAGARSAPSVALAALGGRSDHLTRRVRSLVEPDPAPRPGHGRLVRATAIASCVLAIGFTGAVPVAIASGLDRAAVPPAHACPD